MLTCLRLCDYKCMSRQNIGLLPHMFQIYHLNVPFYPLLVITKSNLFWL